MTIWTNDDGLRVRFGKDRRTTAPDGVTAAEEKIFVHTISDATELQDTDVAAAMDDQSFIPAGAIIKDALFVVDTAFTSGGAAVLDLGFKQADGTNVDDDGLDTLALAALTADSVTVSDGAVVQTRTATDVYVMATFDTAAFTAGAGKLYIKYVVV